MALAIVKLEFKARISLEQSSAFDRSALSPSAFKYEVGTGKCYRLRWVLSALSDLSGLGTGLPLFPDL